MKCFLLPHPAICFASLIVLLSALTESRANDEPTSLSTSVSEETEGFLSDPARSGSLVGSIIAGAAVANPLAPILGSVAGYFVGKETDYSERKKNQQNAHARRSFIPEDGQEVAVLPDLADKPLQQAEPSGALELARDRDAEEQPPHKPLLQPGSSLETMSHSDRQQLIFTCSNVKVTQQLPVYCYYYSQ